MAAPHGLAGAAPRPPFSLVALAGLVSVRRAFEREWFGSPVHRLLLATSRARGFAVQARDLRPPDVEAGQRLIGGEFRFAGQALTLGAGGDPWDRASPSARWAVALHRFGWLSDLMAIGEAGVVDGLRLTLGWRRIYGTWNDFSWGVEALERRVFNLACAAAALAAKASEAEAALIAGDLARQARQLLMIADVPTRAAERAAAAALAGGVLAGRTGERLRTTALARLARLLPQVVLPDGGHASRSPEAALELLLDLMTLDDLLARLGVTAPDPMLRAIDRLTGAVRFFRLADRGLASLQGGAAGEPGRIAAALLTEAADGPVSNAGRGGLQRLEGGAALQVAADAAAPARGIWSRTACAHPAAIEVLAGGHRLIVGGGWSPDALAPQAVRLSPAASTVSLGEASCGEPAGGFVARTLGPRLIGGPTRVRSHRQDPEGAVLVEIQHDGWARPCGLRHLRSLYLDTVTDELLGEDRFDPVVSGDPRGPRRYLPYAVRFHLHPAVKAELALDRRSAVLQGPEGPGWRLRNDAVEVTIEESIHYVAGEPKRTKQVVLKGQIRIDVGGRVRWRLARADLEDKPSRRTATRRRPR